MILLESGHENFLDNVESVTKFFPPKIRVIFIKCYSY